MVMVMAVSGGDLFSAPSLRPGSVLQKKKSYRRLAAVCNATFTTLSFSPFGYVSMLLKSL